MNRKLHLFLIALIACGAVASAYVAAVRWKAETQCRNVELVADWDQVQDFAAQSNLPIDRFLSQLKEHGIRGMAVNEDTILNLRDDGFLTASADPLPDGSSRTIVSSFDSKLLDRVREHLMHKLNMKTLLAATRTKEGHPAFVWPGNFERIRNVSVGLPPEETAMLQAEGFDPVARIVNYPAANASNIGWSLKKIKDAGIRKVIFNGEEALGYQGEIKETARLFGWEGLTYGSVEFSKQRGDEELSKALSGDYIRVHSILPAEMTRLKREEMIERYVRAVEERNIRMAYVRLIPYVTEKGIDDQFSFLDSICKGIEKSGYQIGLAETYPPVSVPSVARWIVGIGTAAAAALLLGMLFPIGEGVLFLLFAGLALAHLGLLAGTHDIGRKLIALEAAILFPTISLAGLYGFLRFHYQERRGFSVWRAYLATSGVSALGSLYVVGLLSSRVFMVKAQQFMGIKAAHLAPIFVLAVALGLDFVADYRTRGDMLSDAKRRFNRAFAQPLLLWQIAAGLVALAALVLLALRTGNDPGVGVSPLEMRFRSLLDHVLYVRPRTKEFLFGHPALLLALFWSSAQARLKGSDATGWRLSRAGLVFLLLIGGIGQVSIVNTFCHIHTPLRISLIRILNGLWTGAILGAILYRFVPKGRSASEAGAADRRRNSSAL